MPAARAACTASAASPDEWMRPRKASSAGSKLCTPMLSRLIPIRRSAVKRLMSTVPGLASLVISASGSRSKAARQASTMRASSSAGSAVGVPPPKNNVFTAGRPRAAPANLISRTRAAVYGSNSRFSPAYVLKSQ